MRIFAGPLKSSLEGLRGAIADEQRKIPIRAVAKVPVKNEKICDPLHRPSELTRPPGALCAPSGGMISSAPLHRY
jgi:hypothetical protein